MLANEIDPTEPNSQYFVQKQYQDFYNRAADQDGLNFWTGKIDDPQPGGCGDNLQCIKDQRAAVSWAFMKSQEFINTHPAVANPPGTPSFNPSVYNLAFVKQCFYTYLQRPNDPETYDPDGYNFWLYNINTYGDYAGVVNAFITVADYRKRFGQV